MSGRMNEVYKKLRIESKMSGLRLVESCVDTLTSELGISQDSYGKILVATMEAVNNAIQHGNKSNPEKYVEVEITLGNKDVTVVVTDEGKGFDPKSVPDPTRPENIEEINGRGVFLMSKLADRMEYNSIGNSVKMTFLEVIP